MSTNKEPSIVWLSEESKVQGSWGWVTLPLGTGTMVFGCKIGPSILNSNLVSLLGGWGHLDAKLKDNRLSWEVMDILFLLLSLVTY
jgi:hypothetical protein